MLFRSLVWRSPVYRWESGRDPEFSTIYGRMCYCREVLVYIYHVPSGLNITTHPVDSTTSSTPPQHPQDKPSKPASPRLRRKKPTPWPRRRQIRRIQPGQLTRHTHTSAQPTSYVPPPSLLLKQRHVVLNRQAVLQPGTRYALASCKPAADGPNAPTRNGEVR